MLELSIKEARRLMLGAQLLAGRPPKRPTKQMMRDTIRHLGALQIDSISVVARSHHIVLWSRLGNHPPEWLDELLGKDRALFEYWAHAAAFVPIEHYPFFRRMMLSFHDGSGTRWSERTREWIEKNRELVDGVIDHIREHGAVSTSTFAAPEGAERAAPWAWYGNKPTNLALEMLWTNGTLMVDRREKFQRWYDLTERVHPTWDDRLIPSVEEERNTLAAVALAALGVSTVRWLPDYFRKNQNDGALRGTTTRNVLEHLAETGFATRARIKGIDDDAYVQTALLDEKIPLSRTTLLSPFDSLVWDRRRAAELFSFPLMLEAYTPAPKRQYGYFSLPILYRDQLVGRLDPKAERKSGQFIVKALHLEPWFAGKDDERFYVSLAANLRDFATFNGCMEFAIERSDPGHAGERLADALGLNVSNDEAAGL
ncbi:MAG TPA: crosslink repair DNA glycosylase YcaQ family protein [Thermomicrobiales bacterium]|nr:crosslink repair DNA glycosylase YcaQ family protein [Thermomicrobiales bacterium]